MKSTVINILSKQERGEACGIVLLCGIAALFEAFSIGLIYPAAIALADKAGQHELEGWIARFGLNGLELTPWLIAAALATAFIVKNVTVMAAIRYKFSKIYGLQERLSHDLIAHYINHRLPSIRKMSDGQKVSLAVTESQQLIINTVNPLANIIAEGFVIICVLFVMLLLQPVATLAAGSYFTTVTLLFERLSRDRVRRWGFMRKDSDRQRQELLRNVVESRIEIYGMGLQHAIFELYDKVNRDSARMTSRKAFVTEIPKNILEISLVLGLALLIVFLGSRDPAELFATLALFGAAAYRLLPSISRIMVAVQSLKFGRSTLESLVAIAAECNLSVAPPKPVAMPDRIDTVEVTSGGLRSPNGDFLSGNFSIRACKGDLIAIVGASGSGKSTFLESLICGAHDTAITLNGHVHVSGLHETGHRLGIVSQSPLVLIGTIHDNIAIGRSDHAEFPRFLKEAAGVSPLAGPDDKLLQSRIEKSKLSGGQIQRIALARALARNPEVLILDEPTSALHEEFRKTLIVTLKKQAPKRITLIVTHDMQLAKECSRRFRLHGNALVEYIDRP